MSKVAKFANQAELAAARKILNAVVVPPAPPFRPRFPPAGLRILEDLAYERALANLLEQDALRHDCKDYKTD
jgi:hypothetical protein